MRLTGFFTLWMVLLSTPAQAMETQHKTLVVVGDSLSAAFGIPAEDGWVSLLAERLQGQGSGWRVVNAGISGDTTAGGLSRLPRLLEIHRPQLLVLELGSNDGLRGFGFDKIRANLSAMIRMARAAGARVLLVGGRIPPNYGEAYAEAFHQVYHQLAADMEVALVPFLLQDVAQNPELMQADGYHPNQAAQPVILNNVWPLLQPMLQQP